MTVHPAIFAEDNIRELLYNNEESRREATPLSLNIYLAISLGNVRQKKVSSFGPPLWFLSNAIRTHQAHTRRGRNRHGWSIG